jgi:hypothetical protein
MNKRRTNPPIMERKGNNQNQNEPEKQITSSANWMKKKKENGAVVNCKTKILHPFQDSREGISACALQHNQPHIDWPLGETS